MRVAYAQLKLKAELEKLPGVAEVIPVSTEAQGVTAVAVYLRHNLRPATLAEALFICQWPEMLMAKFLVLLDLFGQHVPKLAKLKKALCGKQRLLLVPGRDLVQKACKAVSRRLESGRDKINFGGALHTLEQAATDVRV